MLGMAMEEILKAVWDAEKNWTFDDMLDMIFKHRRQD